MIGLAVYAVIILLAFSNNGPDSETADMIGVIIAAMIAGILVNHIYLRVKKWGRYMLRTTRANDPIKEFVN